jgi:hypothetical protein
MRTLRRLVPGLAALALLASSPAAAQDRQLVGARVRITAPTVVPQKITGQVTQFDTAQLVVRDSLTGTEQAFPLHSIRLMEISKGRSRGSNAGGRAGLLAFLFGGLGAIGGALIHPASSVGTSAALGGAGGVVLGAGLGAAWGAGAPRERWEWSVRPFGYAPNTVAPAATTAAAAPPAQR